MSNAGIHFTNRRSGPTEEMFSRLRLARPDTVKLLLFHDWPFDQTAMARRIRAEHPSAFIFGRLFADMRGGPWSVREFVDRFIPVIQELRGIVDWFQVHNEPNHHVVEWPGTDEEFRAWITAVAGELRAACPWVKLIFPGQALIEGYVEWWQAMLPAIRLFDAWGVDVYYQHDPAKGEDNWDDRFFGRCYEVAREICPDIPIIVTEMGDSTDGRAPEDKLPSYLKWIQEAQKADYVLGSACFILGGTDDWSRFELTERMCRAIGERSRVADPPALIINHAKIARYTDLIVDAGKRYEIDPRVISAVIWLESRGNPDSISSANAVGLMQVVPMAGRPSKDELLDPAVNIDWGCKILRGNLDHFGGDLKAALCAYYMGVAGFEARGIKSNAAIVYLDAFQTGWETLWAPEPLPWEEDEMAIAERLMEIVNELKTLNATNARIADALEAGAITPPGPVDPPPPPTPPPAQDEKPALWSPYLDRLGVTIERRGDWEIVAGWCTHNGSWDDETYTPKWAWQWINDTLGGDHNVFGRVESHDGSQVLSNTFGLSWANGRQGDQRAPEASGWANLPIWGSSKDNEEGKANMWDPDVCQGPYDFWAFGGDKVHGLGLPWNQHVSFFFVWRKRA